MSKSKEYSYLTGLLRDIQEKPQLYGEPEVVAVVTKYIFHCSLVLQNKDWSWFNTESLWREIIYPVTAENNYFIANHFDVKSNQLAWVDRRSWGEQEDKITEHILTIFQKIWEELQHELQSDHFHMTISLEVKNLLTNETSFVNPDVTAMVYRNLIGYCLDDEGYKLFLDKYVIASKKEHRGDSSLGLLQIGLESFNPPIFSEWDDMYVQIAKMVQEAFTHLKT